MELKYIPIFIILLIISIAIIALTKKKKIKYKDGIKIANTSYIKNSDIYQRLLKEYKVNTIILYSLLSIALFSAIILISRPSKINVSEDNNMNRDIILCMDVSASVDELNAELVSTLKSTVNNLKGERFGITVFNSSAVQLVPLTDDYDYVIEVLDTIKAALTQDIDDIDNDDYFYLSSYITSGTLEGGDARGSSLIGDGLASCAFNFSDKDEKRTKIIIFSTDNDLAGKPLIDLDKAADIGKSKNIRVYGIGPEFISSSNQSEFENAVKKTGGKYYNQKDSKTVEDIVADIETTSKSLLKGISSTKSIDVPTIPFIILIISLLGAIIVSKKVKL